MNTELPPTSHAKDTAGVLMPPPLLFAMPLVAGFLLQHWALCFPLPETLRPVGIVLILLALIPGPWALWVMLRRGVNPEPHAPTSRLVIEGPFRFTRNPIYLTFTLFVTGMGLLTANGWMVLLLIPTLIVAHYGIILREERYLSRRFGASYDDYQRHVRRWL